MRSISGPGLAKLAANFATEPINILDIYWIEGNSPLSYADRDIGTSIKGRVIELSDLDNVVGISDNNSSQDFSVTLDDTDGSIKAILDSHDIHKRNVCVYQWFDGLALSDKFLLFQGKISSPITWNERERQVSFRVVSQLEDKEIGFSAEEGQFPYLPKDMVGKPWPMIFGTVLDVPALQVNKAVSGSTLCGLGILSGADLQSQVNLGSQDCSLGTTLAQLANTISFNNLMSFAWRNDDPGKAGEFDDAANAARVQMTQAIASQDSATELWAGHSTI
jgi:hypothetical protein